MVSYLNERMAAILERKRNEADSTIMNHIYTTTRSMYVDATMTMLNSLCKLSDPNTYAGERVRRHLPVRQRHPRPLSYSPSMYIWATPSV